MQLRRNSIFVAEKFFLVKVAHLGGRKEKTSNRDSLLCFNAKQTLLRREMKPND